MTDFTAAPEYFDSREVIERIAELEDIEIIDREPEDQEELDALYDFARIAEDIADWEYGVTFIHDDYFTEYVEDMLIDLGYITPEFPSWIAIDWEATASAVQMDYTPVDFRGETYWARA